LDRERSRNGYVSSNLLRYIDSRLSSQSIFTRTLQNYRNLTALSSFFLNFHISLAQLQPDRCMFRKLAGGSKCGANLAARQLRSFATPRGDGAALKFERTLAERKLSHGQLSPRGEILPGPTKDCSLWKVIPSGAGWPVEHLRRSLPNFGCRSQSIRGGDAHSSHCSIALQPYHGAVNRANRPVTNLQGTRYSRTVSLTATRWILSSGSSGRKAIGLLKRVRSC
jgi:hypothetical protein